MLNSLLDAVLFMLITVFMLLRYQWRGNY